MRRVVAFVTVAMDGYDQVSPQEFDFWPLDQESDEFSVGQHEEADTLLFGRVTYDGMAAYWPTAAARQDSPTIADRMNTYPKLVVSRSLERAGRSVLRGGGLCQYRLLRIRVFDSGNVLLCCWPRSADAVLPSSSG